MNTIAAVLLSMATLTATVATLTAAIGARDWTDLDSAVGDRTELVDEV